MSRRIARARMIVAQTQLNELDAQLDANMQRFRQRLSPTKLLAGSFAAGFATILLPRKLRVGLVYTFGSIAWPLIRLFAPTMLQSFLQQADTDD
jgi:heme O synthase-like polyprenyltransferase